MQELLLKEKELEVEREKLEYEDVKGVRELEMASYKVDDPYVRQTRPMILRRMFVLCCAYALYAPLCVVAIKSVGADSALMNEVLSMVKWIGGWLFGTFASAYLGYAAARSVDKRHPEFKEGSGMLSKIANTVLKKG